MPYSDPEKRRAYHAAYHQKRSKADAAYVGRNRSRAKQARVRERAARQRLLLAWKRTGCAFCDEREPVCLDAHHMIEATKEFSIANEAYRCNVGRARFEAELAKCICICSNCHRKLQYGRLTSMPIDL